MQVKWAVRFHSTLVQSFHFESEGELLVLMYSSAGILDLYPDGPKREFQVASTVNYTYYYVRPTERR